MSKHDIKSADPVSFMVLEALSQDGCHRQDHYQVSETGVISPVAGAHWTPGPPHEPVESASLETVYKSGRRLKIDLNGDEHEELAQQGRLEKLMKKIVSGRSPGHALQRQLTKAYDLPPLPKVKTPKFR